MHCPVCDSPNNFIARSRRNEDTIVRIRECRDCHVIWSSSETIKCTECGSNKWSVIKVKHYGPDQKIRFRQCLKCNNEQYTIERKITGNKQGHLKFNERKAG